MTPFNNPTTYNQQLDTLLINESPETKRGKDGKDDWPIKGYGHPLLRNKFKKDERQNDNGIGYHDKSGKEDIEGKSYRAEFQKKQINKE